MDFSIAAILAQDGITSGAIYALLALALVLVFSVTRIIFIPQGEFVAFGALTLAALQSDKFPSSSVLLLLIVSVGVHYALVGLGLVMFGAEGSRTTPFSDARFEIGAMAVSGQSLVIIGVSLALIVALYFYFERTLSGKALRATAVN